MNYLGLRLGHYNKDEDHDPQEQQADTNDRRLNPAFGRLKPPRAHRSPFEVPMLEDAGRRGRAAIITYASIFTVSVPTDDRL